MLGQQTPITSESSAARDTSIEGAATSRGSADSKIGQLLLLAGKLKPEDVKAVVVAQQSRKLRFGDAAIDLGLVTRKDVERALSLQFGFPYLHPGEGTLGPELYAAYAPMSPAAEAVRGLRAFLMRRAITEKRKTLAVLGPRARDGASTLAANLAVVFAQLGERTLLIDANLRSPRQDRLLGKNGRPTPGFSSVLGGRHPLKETLEPVSPFTNLQILRAGPAPPNPQELLGGVNFAYIMETIPAIFDVVIVDAPPVLEYPDAVLIAAHTSHCLMVSRRHRSKVADVVSARSQLESSDVAVLGAVLID
jgi:protein-tyrosine kinase